MALTAMASLVAVTLAACAGPAQTAEEPPSQSSVPAPAPTTGPTTPSPTTPASTAAPSAAESSGSVEELKPVSGDGMAEHVHNLAYDGSTLLIGTHQGLWAQEPGQEPVQISRDPFDVMGFTRGDGRWLASGHPGPGMDAPADLGLLQSTDQGRTWDEVSLGGEVDFHRLVTSGPVVVGVNAHDGRVLRSDDSGATWAALGAPGIYDLAMNPDDPSILVGTTPDGPVRSIDGGSAFEPVADAPLLALLAWTGSTLYGIDVDGSVFASTDDGATWERRGAVSKQPAALAADGDRIAALVGNRIVESSDGGADFSPRIVDIPGH
jgi:hypothetical protein